jgi:hypothetical protein
MMHGCCIWAQYCCVTGARIVVLPILAIAGTEGEATGEN